MSKITTEDCKKFLMNAFNLPNNIKLKRLTKYKDSDGLYIREFTDVSGTIYMVKENSDSSLSIVNGLIRSSITKQKENFNAKKYLKTIIDKLEDGEDEDVIEKAIKKIQKMSKEDQKKIANEFYFYFPENTYGNRIACVTDGLNTPLFYKSKYGSETFCVNIYDSLDSEPDLYLSDILRAIIPEYIDKVDEYNFEVSTYDAENPDELKQLTIQGFVDILENLGFRYKNNKDISVNDECILHKLGLKNDFIP